ncbi:MAG: hypothetical protein GX854_10790 [Clostridiales bacterium]|nr:hypothetical protein [Clostridiales bacterium]
MSEVFMEYKYGKNKNYEDFSAGRVLYNAKGMTNFPVRLAQEIYGRCLEYSPEKENICLYDCCCGGGYLLTVLGFLNQNTIEEIIGSDIDSDMLRIAEKNLSLLSNDGINRRILEIEEMIAAFNKQSHIEARNSAMVLKGMISNEIKYKVFGCDALKTIDLEIQPDIIITDVPYGNLVNWSDNEGNAVDRLLDSLYEICSSDTVIGLCLNKQQRVRNEKFMRLERQQIGKRRFEIFRKK